MKRSKIFILLLIIALNLLVIYNIYKFEIYQEAKEVSKNQHNLFLGAQNSLRQMSQLVFELEIDKDQYKKILYDAIQEPQNIEYYHNLLYQKILPLYHSLQKVSIRQLHFHLPGVISFLRMHRPQKFGDSLVGVRKSIELAQREKRAVFGFEEGRIYNGFRNVYPLFYKNHFVGTVEISFSAKAISHFLNTLTYKPFFTGLLLKERVIKKKVFSSEQKNYIPSPFPGYKWDKKILAHQNFSKVNYIVSSIKYPPTKETTFFIDNFSITFIPIRNFENQHVASFISIYKNSFLATLKRKMLLLGTISTLIVTLLVLLFFKNQERKIAYENFLKEQSFLDPLTKINNRRGLYAHLHPLLEKLKKEHKSYCILFLDIDHFKKLNDTYGHEVGDKVLQALANILQENFRQEDIIARWGGEEFIVILPKTDLQTSIKVASNLLQKIHSFQEDGIPKFTISIGIACDKDASSFKETLKQADLNLYQAKELGRDQIQFTS